MQLFVLDKSPALAAAMLWEMDKLRANKQLLECCQCIAACDIRLPKSTGGFYSVTHKNHPIVRWMRESIHNLDWTIEFAKQLSMIYTTRTGKIHGCDIAVRTARNHINIDPYCNVNHIYVSNVDFAEYTSIYDKYKHLLEYKYHASKHNKPHTI